MKKTIFTLLFLVVSAITAQAQNIHFGKGDLLVNAGIGVGSHLYNQSGFSSKAPLVFASFEVGVADNLFDERSSLGIGAYIGRTSAKWGDVKYRDVVIGAVGNLHYQLLNKLDTYGSVMIGYDNSKVKNTQSGVSHPSNSGLEFHTKVGVRYYFTPNFAAMSEIGYGVTFLNFGLTYKF